MDTKKWKSVLVPTDIYEEIVTISHVEGRTISGQLRIIFEFWKRESLTPKDVKFLQSEMRERKLKEEAAEAQQSPWPQ